MFSLKAESDPAARLAPSTFPDMLLKKKKVMPQVIFLLLLVMNINHIKHVCESGASIPARILY